MTSNITKFIFGVVCAVLFIIAVKRTVAARKECKQSEILKNGKCVPNTDLPTCAPGRDEADKNADIFRLSEDNKCLPSICKRGYALSKDKCVLMTGENTEADRNAVQAFLNSESNNTDRIFIDLDNDFNLDTVINKFLNYEECNKGKVLGCAKDLVDYCDNNPTGQKFSVDCGKIVGNIGPQCGTNSDCGESSNMKCKRTPDGSKSYCA